MSTVENSYILIIGRPEVTEFLRHGLMNWIPPKNILQSTTKTMKVWLQQHQKDGSASGMKHFIYMGDVEGDSDEYEEEIVKDYFTIKEFVDDMSRVDVFLCRAFGSHGKAHPPPVDFFKEIRDLGIVWRPFFYDLPEHRQMQLEYIRQRFKNSATGPKYT